MKKLYSKIGLIAAAAGIVLGALFATEAVAGTPQQLGSVAGIASLGTGTITNDTPQTVRQLKAVRIHSAQPNGTAAWTAVISRISTVWDEGSTNTFVTTNVLGSVAAATGGVTAVTYYETNATAFVFYGDLLRVTGAGTGSFNFVQTHEVLP